MSGLTAERLRSLLDYDPETGVFRWSNVPRAGIKAGAVAGNRNGRGYWLLCLDGKRYMAHRVAWLYVYGRWPADQIDHIDGIHANNAIANLREATNSQNNANRAATKSNRSGFKGVHWSRSARKWIAQIKHGGKIRHIGQFSTAEDAACAYAEKAKLLHGDFAKF